MSPIQESMAITKRILKRFNVLGTIYMLHRCSPINNENLYWNEHMKVSPEYLKNFLNERRKTHSFISLDDLYEMSISKEKIKNKKKIILMTFDDGYRDNYEYVLPIFDEMSIPFTVYITNSFPDKTSFLWWYVLEDILMQNDRILLSNGEKFDCQTKTEKEKLFLHLRQIILCLNQENLLNEFINLFSNYKFSYFSYNDALCLSWDMIREMTNNRFCTIAAHTMNDKTLNKLLFEQLDMEIKQSKKKLEELTGKEIRHFAYPFGTFDEIGDKEIEYVKKCEFYTACYSFGGGFTKKNINRPLELPRKFFGELKH
jgi:peptidoglycan/xylan/chitin deacetylase (PgdA/CDA1 family)